MITKLLPSVQKENVQVVSIAIEDLANREDRRRVMS